jgi:hypothetical protein
MGETLLHKNDSTIDAEKSTNNGMSTRGKICDFMLFVFQIMYEME